MRHPAQARLLQTTFSRIPRHTSLADINTKLSPLWPTFSVLSFSYKTVCSIINFSRNSTHTEGVLLSPTVRARDPIYLHYGLIPRWPQSRAKLRAPARPATRSHQNRSSGLWPLHLPQTAPSGHVSSRGTLRRRIGRLAATKSRTSQSSTERSDI